MATDINIKYIEHPRYEEGEVEVSSEFEQLLQQIELILFTEKGTVLGHEDFGASIEDYLFQLNVNSNVIQSNVKRELEREIEDIERYNISVKADVFDRASDSIGILEITLEDVERRKDVRNRAKLQAIFNQ